ncbi:trimeric intracellular cation channel family protein [soil metagenome]
MDLIDVLVWLGTLTFAATGALVAVRKRFDLVGVVVLGAVTAIGGGSVRDLMAGVIPPTTLTDPALLWGIVVASLAVFFLHRLVAEGTVYYFLDTVGLALFATLGAERALDLGFGFWGTVFAGVLSGVGGGVIRDVLSGEVPGILYRAGDFYASAAAGGAAVAFLLIPVNSSLGLSAGIAMALVLRIGSRLANLSLPVPRQPHNPDTANALD